MVYESVDVIVTCVIVDQSPDQVITHSHSLTADTTTEHIQAMYSKHRGHIPDTHREKLAYMPLSHCHTPHPSRLRDKHILS